MKDEFVEKAESVIKRTVPKESADGWTKVANRHVLVDDIAEALQAEYLRGRETMREEALRAVQSLENQHGLVREPHDPIFMDVDIQKAIRGIEV